MRLHIKALIPELDRLFVPIKLTKRALFQDYVRLLSHLTYSRYVQGRNRAESIQTILKIEYKISIGHDAKYNKNRQFVFDQHSLFRYPYPPHHFNQLLSSTSILRWLIVRMILACCSPSLSARGNIDHSTLVSGFLSNWNPSKSPSPDRIHHSFLRMLTSIVSQPLATLISLSRLVASQLPKYVHFSSTGVWHSPIG